MTIAGAPGTRPSAELRLDVDGIEALAVDVVQRDGQGLRLPVDPPEPEELQPVERRPVLLHARRDAEELGLRPEAHVDLAGAERAGVDRPGDELPERVEVAEPRGALRRIAERGGV